MINSKGYSVFACLVVLSFLWVLFVALTTENSGGDNIFSINTTKFHHRSIYGKQAENSSKWIIVTTSSSQHLNHTWINQVKNWKIIICTDNPDQKRRESWFMSWMPFSSKMNLSKQGDAENDTLAFTDRELAYLYAISHGAQIIYDLDGNNELSNDWEKPFRNETSSYQLQCSGRTVFNAYRHYGQYAIWPRGFPVDRRKESSDAYHVTNRNEPAVVQVLSNGDADVDYHYRMTLTSDLNITFDAAAPTVTLPSGIMAPINSKNTIFRYSALWALVIPLTPPSEHRDIIRGYWAQRLLWELNSTIGFYPPNGRQSHNNTKYYDHSEFQFSKLIDFLRKWTCDLKLTFFQCVKNLSKKMVEVRFWSIKDYQNVCRWLKRLRLTGYIEPNRQSNISQHHFYPISYHPTEQPASGINRKWQQVLGITSFCKNSSFEMNSDSLGLLYSPNILLAIVFSEPFYVNLPYLHLIYGVTFSHIVICGGKIESFKNTSRKFHQKVTFVAIEMNRGHFGYKCLLAAMMIGYDVSGYLLIGDDTLVNVWRLSSLSIDHIWFPTNSLGLLYRNQTDPWHWWQNKEGRGVFNKAWSEVQQLRNSSSEMKDIVDKFTNTLKSNTGSELGLYHEASDFVYVPRKYRRTFIVILEIFAKHNVFLEVVVPTLIGGIVDKKSIVNVQCQYLWYDGKRDKVPELFKSEDVFLHPVKLSGIRSKLKNFFCHKYFPLLLKSRAHKN